MPFKPLRILLLEDDESDAQLAIHALKQLDSSTRVDVAGTRKHFTESLASHQYDVVLADFGLPNWTGMEALRELRRLGFDIPLIVVTGELGDERAAECVKGGAADYILKGNLARLPIAVKRAVEEKRARDESQRGQLALEESAEAFGSLPKSHSTRLPSAKAESSVRRTGATRKYSATMAWKK